jgi:hypothetical protein
VLALHGRKVKRGERRRTVCAKLIDPMIRMAPHSDPSKEPAVTCDTCVDAVTAVNEIADRPVRSDWPERIKK